MKPHLRRRAGRPNFYKLASWDAARRCWADGKRQYDTKEAALAAAKAAGPGRYRLSWCPDNCPRFDLPPFEVLP